jgi:hypothetical protein
LTWSLAPDAKMVPPWLSTAVLMMASPPAPVASIVPVLVSRLAPVSSVSPTDALALIRPWLFRNMVAPRPMLPAPEIVLLALISV